MTPQYQDVKRKTQLAENLGFALHTLKSNLMTNLEQTWDVYTA